MKEIVPFQYNIFSTLRNNILILVLVLLSFSLYSQSESKFQFEVGAGFRSEYLGELATSTFFLVGHRVRLKYFDVGLQYVHGISSFGYDRDRNITVFSILRPDLINKQELRHTSNLMFTLRRSFNFFHLSPFVGLGVGLQYRPQQKVLIDDNTFNIPILPQTEAILKSNIYGSYALEFGYNYNNIGNKIILNFTGRSYSHETEQNYSYKPRPLISLATTYSIGEKDFKKENRKQKKVQPEEEENYVLLMDVEAGMLHTFPVGNKNINLSNTHLYFEGGFYFLKRFGVSCFFQFPGRPSGKNLPTLFIPRTFDGNAPSEIQAVQGAFNYAIINKEKLRLEGSFMAGKFETEDFGNFGWTIRLSLKSGLFKNAFYFTNPGRGFPKYFGWQTGLRLNFRKQKNKAAG